MYVGKGQELLVEYGDDYWRHTTDQRSLKDAYRSRLSAGGVPLDKALSGSRVVRTNKEGTQVPHKATQDDVEAPAHMASSSASGSQPALVQREEARMHYPFSNDGLFDALTPQGDGGDAGELFKAAVSGFEQVQQGTDFSRVGSLPEDEEVEAAHMLLCKELAMTAYGVLRTEIT